MAPAYSATSATPRTASQYLPIRVIARQMNVNLNKVLAQISKVTKIVLRSKPHVSACILQDDVHIYYSTTLLSLSQRIVKQNAIMDSEKYFAETDPLNEGEDRVILLAKARQSSPWTKRSIIGLTLLVFVQTLALISILSKHASKDPLLALWCEYFSIFFISKLPC